MEQEPYFDEAEAELCCGSSDTKKNNFELEVFCPKDLGSGMIL
jgi:hypothetical protein